MRSRITPDWSAYEHDANISAIIEYSSGAVCHYTLTHTATISDWRIMLQGERGTLRTADVPDVQFYPCPDWSTWCERACAVRGSGSDHRASRALPTISIDGSPKVSSLASVDAITSKRWQCARCWYALRVCDARSSVLNWNKGGSSAHGGSVPRISTSAWLYRSLAGRRSSSHHRSGSRSIRGRRFQATDCPSVWRATCCARSERPRRARHVYLGETTLTWRYVRCLDDHFVDLTAFYHTCHYLRSWAYAQVIVPAVQQVTLILTTNGPADLWLNGRHIHRQEHFHHQIRSQRDAGTATLRAGRNEILVRFEEVAVRECPYAMALRIVELSCRMRPGFCCRRATSMSHADNFLSVRSRRPISIAMCLCATTKSSFAGRIRWKGR